MRAPILSASVAAIAACSPHAESPKAAATDGAAQAIFREIDVRPLQPIALGAPFDQRPGTAALIGPGVYVLLLEGRGGFGGTDSLLVRVGPDNRVTSLRFVYPASQDYTAMLREYEGSLGRPGETATKDSAGGRLERAAWEDARTRFEVTRFSAPGQAPKLTSVMFDRAGRR